MLEILIAYYNKFGKSPTKRDIPGRDKIIFKYGSWNNALIAAGLPVNRKFNHSHKELISTLKRFYTENSKSPTSNDCNKIDYLFDFRTYLEKLNCKTWSDVLLKAGLNTYYERSLFIHMNDEDLLLKINEKLKGANRYTQIYYIENHDDLPSYEYLRTRFGSWNSILKKLNIPLNINKYTDDELIKYFYDVRNKINRVPSVLEFQKYSGISFDYYRSRFGSWRKFLDSIKEKYVTKNRAIVLENNDELLKMYIDFSLKNSFINGAPSSALNNSDDIYSSDVYTLRFKSINNLRSLCGFKETGNNCKYSIEYFKLKIKKIYLLKGRIPTNKDIIEAGISRTTLCRYFCGSNLNQIFKDFLLS